MSEVTICNLALAHLGDTAQVVSIKPPDPSVQAQLCANFYYVARNSLLEMAAWGFATRRVVLAALTPLPSDGFYIDEDGNLEGPWRHIYALPAGVINVLSVQQQEAPADYEAWFGPIERDYFPPYPQGYLPVPGAPLLVPQPFSIETRAGGSQVVLTNVCDAVMRYTTLVEDTTKFSPLFTMALSHLLASMLAGPLLKGDVGAQAATQQLALFNAIKGQASSSDANQRRIHVTAPVAWIRGR